MTQKPSYRPSEPRPALVRRLMARHGLPEPAARAVAFLIQGGPAHG